MDISYLAGLVDGEGYIGIQEAGGSMQLRLKVAMTDKGLPTLRAVHRAFGGHLSKDRDAGERTREAHVWRLNGRAAAGILERLLPLLLTKAEPARIALQFQSMIDAAPKRTNRQAIWDEEMHRKARVFRARIQEANRTGPDQPEPVLPSTRPLAVRKYGEWWEPDEDLFGPVEFSGRLPLSGRMISGRVYPLPAPKWDQTEGSPGLLPTPRVSDTNGSGEHGTGGPDLRTAVERLFPTPRASDGVKGGPNQRGSSGDLMLPSAVMALLPTPVAQEPGGTLDQYRERLRRHDGRESTFMPLSMLVLELCDGENSSPPSDAGNGSSDAPPPTP